MLEETKEFQKGYKIKFSLEACCTNHSPVKYEFW